MRTAAALLLTRDGAQSISAVERHWRAAVGHESWLAVYDRLLNKLAHQEESIRRASLALLAKWLQHRWSLAALLGWSEASTAWQALPNTIRNDTDWEVKVSAIRVLETLLDQVALQPTADSSSLRHLLQLYRLWEVEALLACAVQDTDRLARKAACLLLVRWQERARASQLEPHVREALASVLQLAESADWQCRASECEIDAIYQEDHDEFAADSSEDYTQILDCY